MLRLDVDFLATTLVTALALSLDALAVSIAAGLARGRATFRDAAKVGACFGGMQAAMPLLGAGLGAVVRPLVERFAPYLAGAVLIGLGLYAVREALSADDEEAPLDFFEPRVLFGLGLATSLDAFAVGVSLGLAGAPLLPSAALIGLVTFSLCFAGVLFAERVERLLGARAEVAGGIALVALGAWFVLRAARGG